MLSDADLDAMTPAERIDLAVRLASSRHTDLFSERDEGQRRRFMYLIAACCLAMVPWILVLGESLPHHYTADHWTLTWVGFDVALTGLLAATATSAWQRRPLFVITATATATLLACDAWFDITTSAGGRDTSFSVASAIVAEVPLAVVLLRAAHRLSRGHVRRSRLLAGAIEDTTPSA